tara:strand:+ start:490 stop:693 length:204 start_codon:yes stop_codon:yes gene_type:complete
MKTKFEIEKEYNSEYDIFDAKEDFKFYVSEKVRRALKEYNPEYSDNNKNDIIIDDFLNRLFDETSNS